MNREAVLNPIYILDTSVSRVFKTKRSSLLVKVKRAGSFRRERGSKNTNRIISRKLRQPCHLTSMVP